MADIIFFSANSERKLISIILKGVAGLIIIYFLIYEFILFIKSITYLGIDSWNLWGLFLVITYGIYVGFWVLHNYVDTNNTTYLDVLIIDTCVLILVILFKFLHFLKLFEEFSFFISMITGLLNDLKQFIFLYVLFLLTFALLFFTLH